MENLSDAICKIDDFHDDKVQQVGINIKLHGGDREQKWIRDEGSTNGMRSVTIPKHACTWKKKGQEKGRIRFINDLYFMPFSIPYDTSVSFFDSFAMELECIVLGFCGL